MPETIKGLIERVTFHNPESGFAVLKVQVRGRRDLVTVVGDTTSVTPGEHVEASGTWVVDRQHGQQFKADALRTTHPATAEGIEKYLASGAIRSIGPKLEAKIVGLYKDQTLEIFDKAPHSLLHIRGIGRGRLKRISQSWEEQAESALYRRNQGEETGHPGRYEEGPEHGRTAARNGEAVRGVAGAAAGRIGGRQCTFHEQNNGEEATPSKSPGHPG